MFKVDRWWWQHFRVQYRTVFYEFVNLGTCRLTLAILDVGCVVKEGHSQTGKKVRSPLAYHMDKIPQWVGTAGLVLCLLSNSPWTCIAGWTCLSPRLTVWISHECFSSITFSTIFRAEGGKAHYNECKINLSKDLLSSSLNPAG